VARRDIARTSLDQRRGEPGGVLTDEAERRAESGVAQRCRKPAVDRLQRIALASRTAATLPIDRLLV
jgi:hypothetical protein